MGIEPALYQNSMNFSKKHFLRQDSNSSNLVLMLDDDEDTPDEVDYIEPKTKAIVPKLLVEEPPKKIEEPIAPHVTTKTLAGR